MQPTYISLWLCYRDMLHFFFAVPVKKCRQRMKDNLFSFLFFYV